MHFALSALVNEQPDIQVEVSRQRFVNLSFPEFRNIMVQPHATVSILFNADAIIIEYEHGNPISVTAHGDNLERRQQIDHALRSMLELPVGPSSTEYIITKMSDLFSIPALQHGNILRFKDGIRRVLVWNSESLSFALEPRWSSSDIERLPVYSFSRHISWCFTKYNDGIIMHCDAFSPSDEGFTTRALLANIDPKAKTLRFIMNKGNRHDRKRLYYPIEITGKVRGILQYLQNLRGDARYGSHGNNIMVEISPNDLTAQRLLPDHHKRAIPIRMTFVEDFESENGYINIESRLIVQLGNFRKTIKNFNPDGIRSGDVHAVNTLIDRYTQVPISL